jgi:hypothetical protein
VEVSPPTDEASTARPLVLMGFAEALAAIEACWSLRAAGFRVAAFTREGTKPGLRHCRGVSVHPVSRRRRMPEQPSTPSQPWPGSSAQP